jgi:hypothetical protein
MVSKKVDKFAVFCKKFEKLNEEGQDTLVQAAHDLMKAHQNVKETAIALLSKNEAPNGSDDEANKIC